MQSNPTVKKATRRELTNECNALEITNGKVTSLMGLSNNEISSNYHLSSNIVLGLLFKLIKPCPLLLMISIIIIIVLPKSEAYPLWIYVTEFALILLILVLKEIYFDIIRRRADEKVNKRELLKDSKVFRDGKELNNLCWGDIKQGDILYLEKGEKAPADLLVLDTQYIQDRQAVVYINTRSITGKVTVQRKKACYLTQVNTRSAVKRNWQKYKKEYLTGKLKYEMSNANLQDFLGYLKLVKDPKTSLITFENFILRESIIKTCWIYGLVVNSGMDCKIIKHIGQKNKNNYHPINKIDRIFQVGLIINIVLGLPFALLTLSNSSFTVLQNLAYHIMIFTLLLPSFLYIGFQLLTLEFSLENNGIEAQITNFSNIMNLGTIDYAFISYNGVLSSGKMVVDQIITASSLYDFKDEIQQKMKRGSRRNGSLSDCQSGSGLIKIDDKATFSFGNYKKNNKFFESIYNNNNNLNNQHNSIDIVQQPNEIDTYFLDDDYKQDTNSRFYNGLKPLPNNKFRVHLEPLRINKEKLSTNIRNEEEESIEMIIAFGLCHQAILKSIDQREIKFEANSRVYSQEILLKLVNNIGIYITSQIDPRTKKQIGLRMKIQEDESKEWFYSRKINRFDFDKKIFSVVVRKEGSQDRILYCKGSPEDMLQKIKDKELKKNIIENKLAAFKNSKAEIIIYGKRTLSNAQYEIYDAEYTKLKMSSSLTFNDLEDFSTKFEKDLQFVCMVGLSSVKSEAAKETVQYLDQKGIKMCVFANALTEIQTLKTLLTNNKGQHIEYVELSGINVQQLSYNLNSIIRKLNSLKKYHYSIILGKECWIMLNGNSSLIQHFLFIAYYANNILAYGFSSMEKAEITKKIKANYTKHLSILSIGSSYSDLLFINESDVSMITSSCDGEILHSDIPSEIKTPNISKLNNIIQFGSWVNKVYNNLIEVSIYRSALIGTVSLMIESIVYYYEKTSFNFDGKLAGFYIVFYGIIQTVFLIKHQYKKKKNLSDSKVEDKKAKIDFMTNIIEGIIHGISITVIVMKTLPNARLSAGRIFPIEALHFSIYFLLICISIFRHKIRGHYPIKSILLLTLVSFVVLFGVLWLGSLVDKSYYKLAIQMKQIWTCYDSAAMIINILIFCLACTLFIVEQKKNSMLKTIIDYYTNKQEKVIQNSKSIVCKDPDYIQLVKHLFKEEQNIQQSINELVGAQFDTNQFKLTNLLQIKKMEHQIKHEFINVQLNLARFKITMAILGVLFLVQILYVSISQPYNSYQIVPFVIGLVFIIIGYIFLTREENIGRNYYKGAEFILYVLCTIFIIYEGVRSSQSSQLLIVCLIFNISTQLIGIRLFAILLVQIISYLIWVIINIMSMKSTWLILIEVVFALSCAITNFMILYKNILGSKKNFILREQIEMQTNQTNDIWTILVPQFVRNFFSQNGEEGGQYKEDSVAILFCYVCNFDSIIQQEQRNVVRILDDLYRQFDKLCSTFAVQKIETVGYTYMAATGIKKIENQMQMDIVKKNKVQRLVNMGQQMIQKCKLFKWGLKKNKDLDIKIGIHVGGVVVGVIGKHKKQFSLIGTNVNTTSRHGSTGGNRSICLSRQARNQLPNFPDQSFIRRDVYMKGLCKTQDDTIPVYLLKVEQAGKRTNKSSGYRVKFKELVLKVIRSNRLNENSSSDDEQQILTEFVNIAEEQNQEQIGQSRDLRKRTTCQGLQNNFNKIQEMKNRKDEIKCYSKLLQFDKNQAETYFNYCYPRKKIQEIQEMIKKEEELDKEYLFDLQKHKGYRDKLFLFSLFILNGLFLIINIVHLECPLYVIILRGIGIIFTLVLIWLSSFFHKYPIINYVFAAIFIYELAIQKINLMTQTSQRYNTLSHFYVMMILTIFSGISSIRFVNVSILAIIAITVDIIITLITGLVNMNPFYQWLYIIYIVIRKYQYQKESIINFRQRKQTAHISNELSKIVSELLPKHAYEKLKTQNFQNRLELTDLFEQCTILFADIKGFTQFSDRPENRKQPENVVKMLRSLFQQFDVLCTEKKVYKVYTIGDCYVVLGFTNCYDRNPIKQAENVVSFAFDMIRKIQQVKRAQPELDCLNMRIGIHTGTIIGGIVGTEIVRYDIYGSDVVVANKFQETGKIGQVHISQETKKLLDQLDKKPYSENNIYPSGKVQVKKLNISYGGYFIKLGNLS